MATKSKTKPMKMETTAAPEPTAETETTAAPESESAEPFKTGLTSDAAHLDALIAEAEAEEKARQETEAEESGDGPAMPKTPVTGDGFITGDAFADVTGKGLFMIGKLTDLETLATSPERETWPAAAAAIYDTIREIPSLHFLIRPGGKWMQRASALGMFAVPVAIGCKMEASAKAGARAKAAKSGQGKPERYEGSAQEAADDKEYVKGADGVPDGLQGNDGAPETVNAEMERVQ